MGKGGQVIGVLDMVEKAFEISAPLPLVAGISSCEEASGSRPVFCSNPFSGFFEFNMARQSLAHFDTLLTFTTL
ncbi:hypothetical protein HanHA89_Chr03g0091671 [Helianthus annuus]|nr:hypothetical protein HanHA89_Chr03g0091671 [Helianthus annuus]